VCNAKAADGGFRRILQCFLRKEKNYLEIPLSRTALIVSMLKMEPAAPGTLPIPAAGSIMTLFSARPLGHRT
jgi:hypothetical protein